MYLTKTQANKFANRLFREGNPVAVRRESKSYTSGHHYIVLYGDQLAAIELFTKNNSI